MNYLIRENRNKVSDEINRFWQIQQDIEDDFTSLAVKLEEDGDEAVRTALTSFLYKTWRECLRVMQDECQPLKLRLDAVDTVIRLLDDTEKILKSKEQ